jgi:hypothetical protein
LAVQWPYRASKEPSVRLVECVVERTEVGRSRVVDVCLRSLDDEGRLIFGAERDVGSAAVQGGCVPITSNGERQDG